MLVFGLHSTSDDRLDWLMDSNPIHHPSPAKKIKCSFLDYIQLLIFTWAGWWTRTPSGPYNIRKVAFCLSCNFSNLFPLKWLGTANFTRFTTFPIFFYWSGSEWPILPNLQLFQSFSTKVAQIMRQCTRPPPPWNATVEIQFFRFRLGLGQYLDDDLHILAI